MIHPAVPERPHYLAHEILPPAALTDRNTGQRPCTPAQWLLVAGGAVELSQGPLNSQELRIVALAATGLVNKEIAREIPNDEHVVANNLSSAYHKLGALNRRHMVTQSYRSEVFRTGKRIRPFYLPIHQLSTVRLIAEGWSYREISELHYPGEESRKAEELVKSDCVNIMKNAPVGSMVGVILLGYMSEMLDEAPKHHNEVYSSHTPLKSSRNVNFSLKVNVDPASDKHETPAALSRIEWGSGYAEIKEDTIFNPRESELLLLLAAGIQNADIADYFGKSVWTIKKWVGGILEILMVKNRQLAVAKAYRTEELKVKRYGEPLELRPRERDVLIGASELLTEAEIAKKLKIDPETVDTHMDRMRKRIGAADIASAVSIGYISGEVRPPGAATDTSAKPWLWPRR